MPKKKSVKFKPQPIVKGLLKPKPKPKSNGRVSLSKPRLKPMSASRKAIRPSVNANKASLSHRLKTMKSYTNNLLENKKFMDNFIKHGMPQPRTQPKSHIFNQEKALKNLERVLKKDDLEEEEYKKRNKKK